MRISHWNASNHECVCVCTQIHQQTHVQAATSVHQKVPRYHTPRMVNVRCLDACSALGVPVLHLLLQLKLRLHKIPQRFHCAVLLWTSRASGSRHSRSKAGCEPMTSEQPQIRMHPPQSHLLVIRSEYIPVLKKAEGRECHDPLLCAEVAVLHAIHLHHLHLK